MRVISDISAALSGGAACLPPAAVAVGLFDGVHRGHRALLDLTRREASRRGLTAAVLTFDDAPGLKPGAARICPLDVRLSLLRDAGMDAAVVLPFPSLRDLSPEAFVREVLTGALAARLALVGYNFRFGKGAEGDADTLAALMHRAGGEAVCLPGVTLPDGSPVSSSRIREAIAAGDMPLAAELLGRPYSLTLPTVHGKALGRTVGLPTVNGAVPEGLLLPGRGVYAGEAIVFGHAYPAVTNVGTRPTVSGEGVSVETHIIGFSGDLYGTAPTVRLFAYLRGERKFASLDDLKNEITRNIEEAKRIWLERGRA